MRIVNLSDGKQYIKGDIFNRRWREILTILSLLVLILTVYIFMLPAVTMEKSCGLTEHTHTDDCYETIETKVLTCTAEATDGHQHTDDCCDEEGNLICEETEALPHQHTDECYELREEKKLICEIKEHVHNAECNKSNNESESKSDDASGDPNDSENSTAADPDDQNAEAKAEEYETDTPQYICGKYEHEHDENCYNADGELTCEAEEHTHTKDCEAVAEEVNEQPTEEQQETESRFIKEVEALEALGELTDEDRDAADDLLTQLQESYLYEEITADTYADLYGRILALLETGYEAVAEAAEGTNWIKLRDSGWFEEYSDAGISSYSARAAAEGDTSPSSTQVDNSGGSNSQDGVNVSKTIKGTDLENVFDITLTVETPQSIDEVISEPDMAVVIVMDISNTMKDNFGDDTRYEAAIDAAEDFLDNFAENNTLGVSKVGYVAFNTDAHQIFGLQSCTSKDKENGKLDTLKNTMRTETGNIINVDGYGVAHNRFTNIEGGLKMAQDMLNGVSNKNKFIILLTDGFPTTYLESGYKGYDPYDTTGRFYDHVLNVPCSSGTSYSDEAAIRARNMAASIRSSGTPIFSIGVDVGGQTIQKYIDQSEKLAKGEAKISVVDRTGNTYEIGSATSTEAYKKWLKDSIGSGYYYDSTNTAGLKEAYNKIFEQIKTTIEEATKADWVATDPIPIVTGAVEFIGFYNKEETLTDNDLVGSHAENAENTASIDKSSNDNTSGTDPLEGTDVAKDDEITWDLKKSGYGISINGDTTTYTYTLKYRVRLKNEQEGFDESTIYETNGTTTLAYRVVTAVNGNTTMSDSKTIEFPIPSVHGYLSELRFSKIDNLNRSVSGAVFTLAHDTETCNECRGDGTSVTIENYTATSGEDGTVTFSNIPSGHKYTLKETEVPDGYYGNGKTYTVTVAYDEVTVKVSDGEPWNGTIVNYTSYELPQTGGGGTVLYTAGGMALILSAVLLLCCKAKRRRERSAQE